MQLRDNDVTAYLCIAAGLVIFLALVAYGWIGYLGADDFTYATGAYGWINDFPYVGGHGSIRHTITIPTAASFLIIGETEFGLAFATICYSIALIAIVSHSEFNTKNLALCILIVALLITNPLLVVWSSVASVDIVEAFFIFASLVLFQNAVLNRPSTRRLLLIGVLTGLAFLTRETTVFLVGFYGILFLFGFGIPRAQYFVIAAGFLAVWLTEVIYLFALTGNPLFRVQISANHDSTIDRSIETAGNFGINSIIDPLLVILLNQEFAFLFWIAIPLGAWLLSRRHSDAQTKTSLVLYGGIGIWWFVTVGASATLLPLNPRYFLVSAIAASVIAAIAVLLLHRAGFRKLAAATLAIILTGNLLGIYVENKNYMFGEKTLVEYSLLYDELIFTDPMTSHRGALLLEWAGTDHSISGNPPQPGSLFVYNGLRAPKPNKYMQESVLHHYQPQPGWVLLAEAHPKSKLAGRIARHLRIEDIIPGKLMNAISEGHPGVYLYRVPENSNAHRHRSCILSKE